MSNVLSRNWKRNLGVELVDGYIECPHIKVLAFYDEINLVKIYDSIFNKSVVIIDVSEKQDKSVIAICVENECHIMANGKIKTPINSSELFAGLVNLRCTGGWKNIDTSDTIIMDDMFRGMKCDIDIRGFDFNNVVSADDMFYGCEKVIIGDNINEIIYSEFKGFKLGKHDGLKTMIHDNCDVRW